MRILNRNDKDKSFIRLDSVLVASVSLENGSGEKRWILAEFPLGEGNVNPLEQSEVCQ